MIAVSGVHELLIKIHDILDNAVAKWVGNSAGILANVFNSASRQHNDAWASQLLFLWGLKDMVPPSEACLHGYINWSQTQAQQQSSMDLSQSPPPMRGGKARPRTWFCLSLQETCAGV